jgi:hypothetical protein
MAAPLESITEAHTIRLALLYALADGKLRIGPQHLDAALSLHDHAARSASWTLDGATGEPLAEQIYAALTANRAGLTRSQISDTLKHDQPARQIDHALRALQAAGRAKSPTRHRRPPGATLDHDPSSLTGLLLLSYPTPRCRPRTAPPCRKSAALNTSLRQSPYSRPYCAAGPVAA